MPKTKTIFICQSCGYESAKWSGRCPQCSEWNTLVETVVTPSRSAKSPKFPKLPQPQRLAEVEGWASNRLTTGIGEFDRVLGGPPEAGGLVPGSVILLAGEPGVGKSTLLLQVAAAIEDRGQKAEDRSRKQKTENGNRSSVLRPLDPSSVLGTPSSVLYVSGEESPSQLKLRADRLRVNTENIQVLAETDVDLILNSLNPQNSLIIVDSVQTLTTTDLSVGAGTISQVRECSQRLAALVKEKNIPLILVGHVTKEGSVAGPKVLEHMVDVVLYLEGDKFHSFRLLRAQKNRFGSDQEVGVFAMGDGGLSEIKNPSDAFLAERLQNASGSVVTATMEGTRPVLVEIQALATNTPLAYPRRSTSGFDLNRLNLLIAVLQKHLKLPLHQKDIYVNVASGFKISEPAADLACALAIVSSVKDQAIDPQICTFGEVGLSGEVRKVSQSERRIKEAKKLGFTTVISPESVRSLKEAIRLSTKQEPF